MRKAFRRHARHERSASVVEVPVPEPEKNQVLLKVSHCGICGSDLHAWLNHPGYESVLPEVTFGHELSGSVISIGPNAGDWKEGDRAVMIALQTSHDSNDRYCVDGLPQLSPRRRVQGLHLDGGMAEYICVDSEFLIPVPDGLDPALAALTEPLSVAEHCIGNRSSVGPGDRVVVSRALFGACYAILNDVLPRWGVMTEFVDGTDLDQWRAALATPAKLVFFESPSNPMLDLVDIPAVAEMSYAASALVVIDNIFATPIAQKPLELGADIVIYSATKHFDGQGLSLIHI